MPQSVVEQRSFPLAQFAIESTSIPLPQCADGERSFPIAQLGNEQRSIPMPQSADGQSSFQATPLEPETVQGHEVVVFPKFLRRNEEGAPTAPADVGVLPVPIKARIDFPVIAGNFAKFQEHPSNARHAENQ